VNYDFSQINDKEFEILAVDLLSPLFDRRIERFKPGRDGGVDGRFFADNDQEVILQCKHYLKTGYKGLISKLKREEADKVKKLRPSKYLFITSLPLSRKNKKEIRAIFSPFIKRDDDVFGQEDLNGLLTDHPEIVERHFKLWISSTVVFNRIINNAIKGRSEQELEFIQKRAKKYVHTKAHTHALDILGKNQVLIISGEPGIGKTILAENICLYFASKDYEFVDVEESLSEAENIYTKGKKQIFYFDDFLGSNYFEAIENKKDSHIVKFIDRVRNDSTKLFILTSRTNILNSGVLHSPIFSNKAIQNHEFLLTVRDLTDIDKARILYNHIWFSELPEKLIEMIYEGKRYKTIIKHPSYNPRLVEFITDVTRVGTIASENYWEYIRELLRNPKDIWSNCFKIQNNAFVRSLVALVVFNGGEITERELKDAFNRIVQIDHLTNPSHTEKDFNSTAQLATKSFLRRNLNLIAGEISYSLFNPSISDYVLNEYSNDFNKLISIYKSLTTLQSLKKLRSLSQNNIITNEHADSVLETIFIETLNGDREHDYLIYLSYLVYLIYAHDEKRDNVLQILKKITGDPAPIAELSYFLSLLTCFKHDLTLNDYGFLSDAIGNRYLDESEIVDLAEFMVTFEIDDENIRNELISNLEDFIRTELDSQKVEIDLSDLVQFFHGPEGDFHVDIDRDSISYELSNVAGSILDNFDSNFLSQLDIDLDNIVSDIDIDEMVDGHIAASGEPDLDLLCAESGSGLYIDDIDDLFERT